MGPFLTKRIKGQIKTYFRNDLRDGIDAAKPYCLSYLSGLAGFGTGVALLGAGTGIGPILAIAGVIVGTSSSPFCQATIKRVVDDYRIVVDPPDPNVDHLAAPVRVRPARFNTCATAKPSTRSACRTLTADAQRLVMAARAVTTVADAASTTMNRYTTATAASNWAASATQGKHLESLTAQSKRAVAALDAAGRSFARELISRHLNWRFTKQDTSRAIRAVLSLLAKQQITDAAISRYAGGALTPGKLDVLRDQNAL
jgi:hypothetical protein